MSASMMLKLKKFLCNLVFILFLISILTCYERVSVAGDIFQVENSEVQRPSVMIAILVRNKAYCLPWFLGQLEKLDYPKERISLWIQSDHNIDETADILEKWAGAVKDDYHQVQLDINKSEIRYDDETGVSHWSLKRMDHMIYLRQQALNAARKNWADYLFMIDADVILTNSDTLRILMAPGKTLIAPMLNTSVEDSAYSNFWAGMNQAGYYVRVDGYQNVLRREQRGVFAVPMVHSAVLIDLRRTNSLPLSYTMSKEYNGPKDDIIQFAFSARLSNISMHVVNSDNFGFVIIPPEAEEGLEWEAEKLRHVRLEALVHGGPPLTVSSHLTEVPTLPDTLGFDQVYLINLERRTERRQQMLESFRILGIEALAIDAVDGSQLNDTWLTENNIKQLPVYRDPYHGRPMTMGEIGCFLSHYKIWQDVLEKGYERVIVFEDDIRFELDFRNQLTHVVVDAEKYSPEWDFLYIGRKRLIKEEEDPVGESDLIVWPFYTYWTLSYAVTREGVQKLIDQKPLEKLVPVDEYLPIMFNKHPETTWSDGFAPRDLVAISAWPLLVQPTYYTGEPNYFSDTEESDIIDQVEEDSDRDEIQEPGASAHNAKQEL